MTDKSGNQGSGYVKLDLPIVRSVDSTKLDEDDIDDFSYDAENITRLTITNNDPGSIVPINNRWQWGQHLVNRKQGASIWERTPDGKLDIRPDGFVYPTGHEDWDWFFYSHANSLIVWDIRGKEYESFKTKIFLPNPCGDVVNVEVTFLVDFVEEIYNSGELRGKDSGKLINFDIPEGAKSLSVEVFDLDEPACDHYILANPHLVIKGSPNAPSIPKMKIATTWGKLKNR